MRRKGKVAEQEKPKTEAKRIGKQKGRSKWRGRREEPYWGGAAPPGPKRGGREP